MRRPTDLEMSLQLLWVFTAIFLVVPAAVATVHPYWIWNRRWKAFATIALVIAIGLLMPAPPNAGDGKPAAPVAVPAPSPLPQAMETPAGPPWDYMDDPNGKGRIGRAACAASLYDPDSPESAAEICVSRLEGSTDAWLRDNNPKFTWGTHPELLLQFGTGEPIFWDTEPSTPAEVGLLFLADPPGVLKRATRGGPLLATVQFDDGSAPRVFHFDLSGLDPAQLQRKAKK